MRNPIVVKCAAACCAVFAVGAAFSAVKPGAPFSDGAILQRGMKVPVWGKADPGESVKVEFAGQ